MALTAIATVMLRKHVTDTLCMIEPAVVETSPEKSNLHFSIVKYSSIDETFKPYIEELKQKRIDMDRTLIFCRRPLDCAKLWVEFCNHLRKEVTEPSGSPIEIPELRLVDCYAGCTDERVLEVILRQFTTPSCLRVVIVTIAFGLGVNCPDIRRVIHFGVPEDIETYVQQVGRAGCDGKASYCILLFGEGVYKRYCNNQILDYCKNELQCCRLFLYSKFGFYSSKNDLINTCACCDVCNRSCDCCKA